MSPRDRTGALITALADHCARRGGVLYSVASAIEPAIDAIQLEKGQPEKEFCSRFAVDVQLQLAQDLVQVVQRLLRAAPSA